MVCVPVTLGRRSGGKPGLGRRSAVPPAVSGIGGQPNLKREQTTHFNSGPHHRWSPHAVNCINTQDYRQQRPVASLLLYTIIYYSLLIYPIYSPLWFGWSVARAFHHLGLVTRLGSDLFVGFWIQSPINELLTSIRVQLAAGVLYSIA